MAMNKLILACFQLHDAGDEEPTRELVGSMAGVVHTSSTMRNACAKLKKEGLADTSNSKTLKLTPSGYDLARELTESNAVHLTPMTSSDFHARNKALLQKMKGGKKTIEIYEYLEDGEARTDDEISKFIAVDKKKSTYRNAKAPLNKLGFLEQVDGDRFRLPTKCFPLGRGGDGAGATAH